jgi:hypothetical protein
MNQHISGLNGNLDKGMTTEQFEQLVEAIIAGKYSWACVLLLRFAGYNPLHYIPYRTYNRLLKENTQMLSLNTNSDNRKVGDHASQQRSSLQSQCIGKIKDLPYLETAGKQKTEVRGGHLEYCLAEKITEYQLMETEVTQDDKQTSLLIFSRSL